MPEAEGFCLEYRPTFRERFWRRLGFRFHLGGLEPNDQPWSGWMQTRSVMHFDWLDRLRILASGRLEFTTTVHMDTPSPDRVHTRLDWEIEPPGGKRR